MNSRKRESGRKEFERKNKNIRRKTPKSEEIGGAPATEK